MSLYCDLDQATDAARGGAISIGNFDGVHRGHALLLKQLRRMADEVNGPAVVLTFDPHPATVLRPDHAPVPLTWIDRRAALLESQGVDIVIACRPTTELLGLAAEHFFQSIIRQKLDCRAMVEGPNFFFGKNRQGNTELLHRLCNEADIPLRIVSPYQDQGQMVSSTLIRAAIESGHIESANKMLTSDYRITGVVAAGAGRGGPMGFPTANLSKIPVLAPAEGVYAGQAWHDAKAYKAAIHVGPNLTFGEGHCKVEVHLLDFTADLYGKRPQVAVQKRIRGTRKFESVDALQAQLRRDVQAVRDLLPT